MRINRRGVAASALNEELGEGSKKATHLRRDLHKTEQPKTASVYGKLTGLRHAEQRDQTKRAPQGMT